MTRAYLALLSARFRQLLQYRAAAVAGVVTQIFFGFVMVEVMRAFYAASTAPQPMTLQQVVTYKWLGQAMLALLPWSIDRDVEATIRNGNVAYELARPMDLYFTWYARGIALRVAPALLRALPIFILATAFWGMQLPASPAAAAAWILSTAAAVALASALTTFVQITLMWTLAGEGVSRVLPSVVLFFSGMVLPIPLFPAWSQGIFYALPFWGLIDPPFRLYTGNIPATQLPLVLAHQLAWTTALILIGRTLLNRGLKRLVVQGG